MPLHDALFLQNVLKAVSDPVFVKDEEHRWILFNDAFCQLLGHSAEALQDKRDDDVLPAAEARVFWEKEDLVFASGKEHLNEERLTDANGKQHILSTKRRLLELADGRRVLVGVIRDMTQLREAQKAQQRHQLQLQELVDERTAELSETNLSLKREMDRRRRAQEEKDDLARVLRHKQRLDEMGQLAGGVAHDFNNLLTVILGNLSYLRNHTKDAIAAGAAVEAHEAAMKAANLSRQLLAFSRRQPLRREALDVAKLIERMERMMSRVLGEHIRLNIDSKRSRHAIWGDETMVEQVFLNLIVNARDALEDGGTIAVELEDVSFDAPRGELAAGDYVKLSVRDDGAGMDSDVLERAFEPFFTTKPSGRGTGLGLSTVHGIVKQHSGRIELTSQSGEGTTCAVWWPRAPEDPAARPVSGPAPVGHETILVVEDEPLVARVAKSMLAEQGYRVLTALSAEEALHTSAEHEGEIHLLMTDVRMPGLNGVQLARKLLERRPGLLVLYTTGYSADVFGEEGPDRLVLAKPYTQLSLTGAVRAVLDGQEELPEAEPLRT